VIEARCKKIFKKQFPTVITVVYSLPLVRNDLKSALKEEED
jgi:hypothetical protein